MTANTQSAAIGSPLEKTSSAPVVSASKLHIHFQDCNSYHLTGQKGQRFARTVTSSSSRPRLHKEPETSATQTLPDIRFLIMSQVILDAGQHRQRRASQSIPSGRPGAPKRGTSCFVHGLFHDRRLRADGPSIPEAFSDDVQSKSDKDPEEHGEDDEGLASRLLTKTQLSDMAFSIRELSKRLGRFRLKLNVHNVFLLTKAHDETLVELTREVAAWLLSEESGGDYTVYVEDTLRDDKNFDAQGLTEGKETYEQRLKYWDNELCQKEPHTFDIIIAVGFGLRPR